VAINRLNPDYPDAGLVQVVPTSVSVGSGSGSVDGNGAVTFSGATSVSLNGCFSSAYANYKVSIVIDDGSWGSGGDVTLNFRTTTDDTSNNYNSMTILIGNTGGTGSYGAGTRTFAYVMPYTATNKESLGVFDIHSPNRAEKTLMTFQSLSETLSVVGGIFTNTTTQYTGFTISAGAMTGTIRVYGYRN